MAEYNAAVLKKEFLGDPSTDASELVNNRCLLDSTQFIDTGYRADMKIDIKGLATVTNLDNGQDDTTPPASYIPILLPEYRRNQMSDFYHRVK